MDIACECSWTDIRDANRYEHKRDGSRRQRIDMRISVEVRECEARSNSQALFVEEFANKARLRECEARSNSQVLFVEEYTQKYVRGLPQPQPPAFLYLTKTNKKRKREVSYEFFIISD